MARFANQKLKTYTQSKGISQYQHSEGVKWWTNHQLNKSAKSCFFALSNHLNCYLLLDSMMSVWFSVGKSCIVFCSLWKCLHTYFQSSAVAAKETGRSNNCNTKPSPLFCRRFVWFMLAQSIYGWIGSWSLTLNNLKHSGIMVETWGFLVEKDTNLQFLHIFATIQGGRVIDYTRS